MSSSKQAKTPQINILTFLGIGAYIYNICYAVAKSTFLSWLTDALPEVTL